MGADYSGIGSASRRRVFILKRALLALTPDGTLAAQFALITLALL
jgi:hypothetical protein